MVQKKSILNIEEIKLKTLYIIDNLIIKLEKLCNKYHKMVYNKIRKIEAIHDYVPVKNIWRFKK